MYLEVNPLEIGSSPRAWGTRPRHSYCQRGNRFIPTCVGNTWARPAVWPASSVHPHVRGEHDIARVLVPVVPGSSPRAWGTRMVNVSPGAQSRFIPTCVGNTVGQHVGGRVDAVHPHVRGEHVPEYQKRGAVHGSSPRAWGTQLIRGAGFDDHRFIPTCVGNTPGAQRQHRGDSVHPHVRGEHASRMLGPSSFTGSSPRAWGTRRCGPQWPGVYRFIPTCVGNTLILSY